MCLPGCVFAKLGACQAMGLLRWGLVGFEPARLGACKAKGLLV